ncbi:MAG: hypothetical protein LBC89_02915 [Bacteroidales bacterium]|nr:hypothetical protein [Bacteroidales bacterium]
MFKMSTSSLRGSETTEAIQKARMVPCPKNTNLTSRHCEPLAAKQSRKNTPNCWIALPVSRKIVKVC